MNGGKASSTSQVPRELSRRGSSTASFLELKALVVSETGGYRYETGIKG